MNSLWNGRLKRVAVGLLAATIATVVLAVVLHFAGDITGSQAASGFATITGLGFVAALTVLVFWPTAIASNLDSDSTEVAHGKSPLLDS